MNVYILTLECSGGMGGIETMGVFSSRDRAEKWYADHVDKNYVLLGENEYPTELYDTVYQITEWTVDEE